MNKVRFVYLETLVYLFLLTMVQKVEGLPAFFYNLLSILFFLIAVTFIVVVVIEGGFFKSDKPKTTLLIEFSSKALKEQYLLSLTLIGALMICHLVLLREMSIHDFIGFIAGFVLMSFVKFSFKEEK